MMRINAARKSILADNSEQFRTIQREKNPSSRKQVPRSKKQQMKNVESFETELLDEIVKFSEKETLSLEACQHIATKLQTTNYLEVAEIQNMLFSWEFFQKLFPGLTRKFGSVGYKISFYHQVQDLYSEILPFIYDPLVFILVISKLYS